MTYNETTIDRFWDGLSDWLINNFTAEDDLRVKALEEGTHGFTVHLVAAESGKWYRFSMDWDELEKG